MRTETDSCGGCTDAEDTVAPELVASMPPPIGMKHKRQRSLSAAVVLPTKKSAMPSLPAAPDAYGTGGGAGVFIGSAGGAQTLAHNLSPWGSQPAAPAAGGLTFPRIPTLEDDDRCGGGCGGAGACGRGNNGAGDDGKGIIGDADADEEYVAEETTSDADSDSPPVGRRRSSARSSRGLGRCELWVSSVLF